MTDAPTLVVDASSARIHCGIHDAERWLSLKGTEGETFETLFPLVEETLEDAGIDGFESLGGIAFCSGPGSILGLRLSAMAVETWCALHPHLREGLHTFGSLEALALHVRAEQGLASFHILTDFRRGAFNHLEVSDHRKREPDLVTVAEAGDLSGDLFYCPQRRVRNSVPDRAAVVDMSIQDLFSFPETNILRPSARATVTVPEAPDFARWEASRHRAPEAPEA